MRRACRALRPGGAISSGLRCAGGPVLVWPCADSSVIASECCAHKPNPPPRPIPGARSSLARLVSKLSPCLVGTYGELRESGTAADLALYRELPGCAYRLRGTELRPLPVCLIVVGSFPTALVTSSAGIECMNFINWSFQTSNPPPPHTYPQNEGASNWQRLSVQDNLNKPDSYDQNPRYLLLIKMPCRKSGSKKLENAATLFCNV